MEEEYIIIKTAKTMATKPRLLLIFSLILFILKQQVLSFLDLYTDIQVAALYLPFLWHWYDIDSWTVLYPKEVNSERWSTTLDQLRNANYWYGMTFQKIFFYTMVPIVLPLIIHFIECCEFIFSTKIEHVITKKMGIFAKILIMIFFPIWPIVISVLSKSLTLLTFTPLGST